MKINPVLLSFGAAFFYAIAGVVISIKLREVKHVAQLSVTLTTVGVMAICARLFITRVLGSTDPGYALPTGSLLKWAFVVSCVLFIADILYVGAYNQPKANVVAITAMVSLVPVFSAIFSAAWERKLPEPKVALLLGVACLCAVVAGVSSSYAVSLMSAEKAPVEQLER